MHKYPLELDPFVVEMSGKLISGDGGKEIEKSSSASECFSFNVLQT